MNKKRCYIILHDLWKLRHCRIEYSPDTVRLVFYEIDAIQHSGYRRLVKVQVKVLKIVRYCKSILMIYSLSRTLTLTWTIHL